MGTPVRSTLPDAKCFSDSGNAVYARCTNGAASLFERPMALFGSMSATGMPRVRAATVTGPAA
jgi:hypothetical protein